MNKTEEAQMLRGRIIEIRNAIRGHRDAKGDERCWLDDYLVWGYLAEPPQLIKPSPAQGMASCIQFYTFRRTYNPDPVLPGAIVDPTQWDLDLQGLCRYQLTEKLHELMLAIRLHHDVFGRRPITFNDDRDLYLVLPEKLPADFRLPSREEFLERGKSGAGCPNFWDSHATCGRLCNLHQWGPCR